MPFLLDTDFGVLFGGYQYLLARLHHTIIVCFGELSTKKAQISRFLVFMNKNRATTFAPLYYSSTKGDFCNRKVYCPVIIL